MPEMSVVPIRPGARLALLVASDAVHQDFRALFLRIKGRVYITQRRKDLLESSSNSLERQTPKYNKSTYI